jgi:hypothetical protein
MTTYRELLATADKLEAEAAAIRKRVEQARFAAMSPEQQDAYRIRARGFNRISPEAAAKRKEYVGGYYADANLRRGAAQIRRGATPTFRTSRDDIENFNRSIDLVEAALASRQPRGMNMGRPAISLTKFGVPHVKGSIF